jgi:serine/threonine-protein kinase
LDKFVQVSENQVKTYIANGKVLESKRINQNGLEFHKLIYSGTQGVFSLNTEQYYFIKSEKAFVVTFVAEEDQFDKYIVIAEKMLQSFKVKE